MTQSDRAGIMLPGVFYALIAGFLAALASSSAKLSLGAVYLKDVCETGLKIWTDGQENTDGVDSTACDWVRSVLYMHLCLNEGNNVIVMNMLSLITVTYPPAAALWWSSVHLQCCDVDLLRQSTQALVFLCPGHCDHRCLKFYLLCESPKN